MFLFVFFLVVVVFFVIVFFFRGLIMQPATRTSPGVVCGLFLALLLLLHGGSAVGDRAGEAGEGGEATGEEREEQGSLGDRSAQIIRQQDTDEGRGNREDTAWSPNTGKGRSVCVCVEGGGGGVEPGGYGLVT